VFGFFDDVAELFAALTLPQIALTGAIWALPSLRPWAKAGAAITAVKMLPFLLSTFFVFDCFYKNM
jgi:hypothetical protein